MTTETMTEDRTAEDAANTKTTYSSCYMCTMDCPITVVSDGTEIISISHPECVRATAMQEQRDSAERLTRPQIRANADEPWRVASWDETIAATADKLNRIKEEHGPDAVAFLVGYTKEPRPYLRRLANAFGSSNYISESSCCFGATFVASKLTFGEEYTHFFQAGRFKQPETKCRLVWSNNPTDSLLPYDRHHLLTEAGKVPTIAVDPRRTKLAEAADIHLAPRPGTDGALALGFAHVILNEGLEDRAFLDRHAHGVDAFEEYVKEFTPRRVAGITGIEAQKIVDAAKLYGSSLPAQLVVSQEALVQHSNGFQNHRAIMLLAALTGNLDVRGGNRPFTNRLQAAGVGLAAGEEPPVGTPMGGEEYPIFTNHYHEGQAMLLAESIEAGKVKAVFSVGTNLMMWPNSKRLEAALRSLELFTVCDFFANPTVDVATVFLPAATHLERQALITALNGRVQHRPAAVTPRGEARGDTEMLFDMAAALGLSDAFWNGDIHASYEERLQGTGYGFGDLPKNGKSINVDLGKPAERSYAENGFSTPTGKVEFASTLLAEAGHDALPVYREPYWSPVSAPEVARDFPLVLTSGGRSPNYTHSQGRMFEMLKVREPEPRLQINPGDAGSRGIKDGDKVSLSSPLGEIEMTAWVTDIINEGVIHAFHGWAQANVNSLIPDAGLDPISGYPPFKSSLCQVAKQ